MVVAVLARAVEGEVLPSWPCRSHGSIVVEVSFCPRGHAVVLERPIRNTCENSIEYYLVERRVSHLS